MIYLKAFTYSFKSKLIIVLINDIIIIIIVVSVRK